MSKVKNPIIRGFNPDPCICRGENKWYIAVSTFEWYPGVSIYESEDFINWELKVNPLDRISLLNLQGEQSSGGIWAPALTYKDGLYWLVYTDVKLWKGEKNVQPLRDMHNYLVTAPSIEGPWSEPIHLISGGYDPSLFHDEDGKKWVLYTKRDFRGLHDDLIGGIILQEYSGEEKKLVGKPTIIYRGANIIPDYFIKKQIYEGSHVLKKDGWYYLITAEGGAGYTHCICVSRSKNIEGPYELAPNTPMLTAADSDGVIQKAGHGIFIEGPGGQWFTTYLCSRPIPNTKFSPLGRESGIAPIEWVNGWPRLVGGGIAPIEEIEVSGEVKQILEKDWYVSFAECEKLPVELMSLRIPITSDWCSLKDRRGFLRLYGQESPNSRFSQSLLGIRIRDFEVQIQTAVAYHPEDYLHMAGLMMRYDENTYYYVTITRDDEGKKVIAYMEMDSGDYSYINALAILPENQLVHLRATVKANKVRFEYSMNEINWIDLGIEKEFYKLSDEYAYPVGFTGAFASICTNDLTGLKKAADFKYMSYRVLNK